MTARRLPEQLSFGGRVPRAIGLLIVVTIALSLAVAFGNRHAGSLFEATALMPHAVWQGQVWRLVTWAFVEPQPLSLIFGCLFLYWFGSDLAREWGTRRFLTVYAGIMLTAAVGTCLVARVDPAVMDAVYLGGWATGTGLTVAWGLWFPHRVIRIYFVIPIRGYVLAWLTVGLTVLFAIYSGWEHFLPELFAEGVVFAWVYQGSVAARFRKARAGMAARGETRRREGRKRERTKKRAQSVAYLRVVESLDDAEPKLSPELDKKLDDLLRGRSKRDSSLDN